jgi:hypothetical protein
MCKAANVYLFTMPSVCCCFSKIYFQGPALSKADLRNAVFEQWLVADLHEIGASCLPAEAANDTKYLLSGYYGLQVCLQCLLV